MRKNTSSSRPLEGVRVVELGGIGPGPFSCMLLADLGAEVIRIAPRDSELPADGTSRGRSVVRADLKNESDRDQVLHLIARADVVIEGFRPGVTERLGLGPDDCMRLNLGLIYGRLTGWGQTGELAPRAGHDLTYIALTGVLDQVRGGDGDPAIPVNMVGDYAGGSLFLVIGVLAALHERQRSGLGQVIDAAIVDGTSLLAQLLWDLRAAPLPGLEPSDRLLGGDAPFYDTYRCADGRYLAIAPIEPQFYARLLDGLGLSGEELPGQWDRDGWPVLRQAFASRIGQRTLDEWVEIFEGVDACAGPVLTLDEAVRHPHLVQREVHRVGAHRVEVAPAPRFSRSETRELRPLPTEFLGLEQALEAWQ